MQPLRLLGEPPHGHYDAIASSKQPPRRSYLNDSRQYVVGRYGQYWNFAQNAQLAQIPSSVIGEPYIEALVHCYQVETVALNRMKANIRAAQTVQWRSACPYCGINTPSTFDHYLCKEMFPEFATLSWNLVPSCGECNSLKGARWLENGQRQFVHAYFDAVPDLVRWLNCEVTILGGDPLADFRLEWPSAMPTALRFVVENHYSRLDLRTRFRQKAAQSLAEAMAHRGRWLPEEYAAEYALEAAKLGEMYGVNYWRALFRWHGAVPSFSGIRRWIGSKEPLPTPKELAHPRALLCHPPCTPSSHVLYPAQACVVTAGSRDG